MRAAKTGLLVGLLACLLLSGCTAAPQSREVGRTAVVSVLAAESEGETLTLSGAAEGREGGQATRYTGTGATPAAALSALTAQGELLADLAHVEHLILGEDAALWLPDLLSYAFQDPQQSTETQLWAVRGEMSRLFAQEGDLSQQMGVVGANGKARRGFAPLTLRQGASRLAEDPDGGLLIPALIQGENGLAFGGYGLWRQGSFAAWFTGEEALGMSLLTGEAITWTGTGDGGAVTLESTRCQVVPRWAGETLTGLTLRLTAKGTPAGSWRNEDKAQAEEETARCLGQAVAALQKAGTDGGLLRDRAGLQAVSRWEELSQQWDTAFPNLTITAEVTITGTTGR
jgi:hypothetical protein